MDENIEKVKTELFKKLQHEYPCSKIIESTSKWTTNKETTYYITFDIIKKNGETKNVWYEITQNILGRKVQIKSNNITK